MNYPSARSREESFAYSSLPLSSPTFERLLLPRMMLLSFPPGAHDDPGKSQGDRLSPLEDARWPREGLLRYTQSLGDHRCVAVSGVGAVGSVRTLILFVDKYFYLLRLRCDILARRIGFCRLRICSSGA